jgi:hypothetical protein
MPVHACHTLLGSVAAVVEPAAPEMFAGREWWWPGNQRPPKPSTLHHVLPFLHTNSHGRIVCTHMSSPVGCSGMHKKSCVQSYTTPQGQPTNTCNSAFRHHRLAAH